MIRIIKTEPHPTVVKQVVCRSCGATLEYTPVDVKQDYSTDYTGGRDYYRYIKCPSCSHKAHV